MSPVIITHADWSWWNEMEDNIQLPQTKVKTNMQDILNLHRSPPTFFQHVVGLLFFPFLRFNSVSFIYESLIHSCITSRIHFWLDLQARGDERVWLSHSQGEGKLESKERGGEKELTEQGCVHKFYFLLSFFQKLHSLTSNSFFSVHAVITTPWNSHKSKHIAKLPYFTHNVRKRWHTTEQGSPSLQFCGVPA